MLFVKFDRSVDIAVRDPVAIGNEKGILFDESQSPFQTPASHGCLAGVDQRDAPVLLVMLIVIFDLGPGAQAQRDVAGVPMVIAEIFLDHLSLVPQAENELGMPKM